MTLPRRSVTEFPPNIKNLSGQELLGWCIYFRVRTVYTNGAWVREPWLRMNLSTAVQHHQIYGRLWDEVGGWGPKEEHKEYELSPEFGGYYSWTESDAEYNRDWQCDL